MNDTEARVCAAHFYDKEFAVCKSGASWDAHAAGSCRCVCTCKRSNATETTLSNKLIRRAETIEKFAKCGTENVIWLLEDAQQFRNTAAVLEAVDRALGSDTLPFDSLELAKRITAARRALDV